MKYLPYILYPIFSILSFIANLLAWVLCPIMAALSVATGKDVSPWPLRLLHTADDTLDGGQHQLGWPKVTGWALVLQRMQWIARNPSGGFDSLLGPPVGPTVVELVGKTGESGEPGYVIKHKLYYKGYVFFSYKRNWLYAGWNPNGPKGNPTHLFKFSLR